MQYTFLFSKILKALIRSSIPLFLLLISISCHREMMDPDPNSVPYFSTDTLTFDTVFTTIGSTTLYFKIFNRNNRPLLINSVYLAGGDDSFFRLNIDGEPARSINNLEIPPDDSLFVFVAVTINPNNSNNPLMIKDSVMFITNSIINNVKLIAYGQDVHLINGETLNTQTWVNDKPYLIYNSMIVDTGETLTISAGSHIYFHNKSSMIIRGRLVVEGTINDPVIFQNDRLEKFYKIIPGQWGSIYLDAISKNNIIDHAIIKNSITGIQIGSAGSYEIPDLVFSNSIIMNTSFAGIYAIGSEIFCFNSVISNSSGPIISLLKGGNYRFIHCTISNNGVLGTSRSGPSVIISNNYYNKDNDVMYSANLNRADFSNNIIYGNFRHELRLLNNSSYLFNFKFDHSLLKAVEDSLNGKYSSNFTSIIINKNPCFVNDTDRYTLNYALDTLSPAKDVGDPDILSLYPFLNNDIAGQLRNYDAKPDLGAFERKED